MKKDLTKVVQKEADELLSLMGTKAKTEVSYDSENESFVVDVATDEETGLLIGRHGETLNSLQVVLGMVVRQETGEWKRVLVNVGDWREKQEEYLTQMAKTTAERAKTTGELQPLYNLTPAQRRVIHLALSEDPEIETESQGEGEERFLIVKPKK